ncbi:MAG: phosphoadenosine phosphosulfate reductase domain-containing protein, partial [Candidatus Hodarchaeales archaeon]
MKVPFLGKVRMHWCNNCQIPLIRKGCNRCGESGIKLNLTPPGDIRPASIGDLSKIILAIKKQFGHISAEKFSKMVKNQILLLNKVPYIDRMDEVYFLGKPIGLFRFNPQKDDFELLPKLPLAKFLWHQEAEGWIDVDIGAKNPIKKGASVLVPGILNTYGNIRLHDPTIVVCQNEVIAVGLAKMDSETIRSSSRGIAVKTKYRKITNELEISSEKVTWKDIVEANRPSLDKIEQEAINFIERVGHNYNNCVVAYSGGKDSLVTLNLVAQSDIPYKIIFANTGLEFPETIENIKLIGTQFNRNVLTADNQSWDFWERFDQFGPPTRNSRWCCKSSKLAPINAILEEHFPNESKVLTFIGKRRYESLGRSLETRVSHNPWIPKQISASPINNWNAFEVYLYIHSHNLLDFLNPLYSQGFIRIGCWVCPASSLSDLALIEQSHPNLFNKLTKQLNKIRKKLRLSSQYISWGLWRWKILPPKVINLLKANNITYHQV